MANPVVPPNVCLKVYVLTLSSAQALVFLINSGTKQPARDRYAMICIKCFYSRFTPVPEAPREAPQE